MKYLAKTLAVLIIGLPVISSAATVAELQAQAQALLEQIAALQAQLGAQTGGSVTSTSSSAPTTVTSNAYCPQIGRVLQLGSTGDDVSRLQQFLAQDRSIYPEAIVSGYYGSLTEAAVKRWQTKYNIVSSGTAATTGFGVTGPRTAAAISLQCSTSTTIGGGAAGGGTPVQGAVGGFIQVSPITGNAPLSVKVTATVNTAGSCTGGLYVLSWGDTTVPSYINVPAGSCNQVVQNYGHTYIYGGTYIITLSSGSHNTSATVVVSGAGASTTSGGGSTNSQQQTFQASTTTGGVPLAVTFSGVVTGANAAWCASGCSNTLDFGDGSTGTVPLPTSQSAAQNYSISHTYGSVGTYTATLYQGAKGASNKVGSPIQITVSVPSQYPPFALTPNVNGNPLAISIQYDITGCPTYSLNWGDGTGFSGGGTSCSSTAPTYSHIYNAAGSYTITLVRGTQTDTAAITISN